MLLTRVLELGVREPAEALDEEHDRGDPASRDLGRVMEWARRKAVRVARDLCDRLLAETDQRLVEEDRLDRPDPLPLDVDVLLRRETLAGCTGFREHRCKPLRAQVALVE